MVPTATAQCAHTLKAGYFHPRQQSNMHEGLPLLALGGLCKFEIPEPRSISVLSVSVSRAGKIPERSVLMGWIVPHAEVLTGEQGGGTFNVEPTGLKDVKSL